MVACILFNDDVEDKTRVTLSPMATVFAADAVPVAILVETDTAEIPVISVPFIFMANEHVPLAAITLISFIVYAYSA